MASANIYGPADMQHIQEQAWGLYLRTKRAPEAFVNAHMDLLSLHATLKEASETVFARSICLDRQNSLLTVNDRCSSILEELDSVASKYDDLGTEGKRDWVKSMKFAHEIGTMRGRLVSFNTTFASYISSSQVSVEQRLAQYLRDYQEGQWRDSIMPTQTPTSLKQKQGGTWMLIRREVEQVVGISQDIFDANQDFIEHWFVDGVASGIFKEVVPKKESYADAEWDEITEAGEGAEWPLSSASRGVDRAPKIVNTTSEKTSPPNLDQPPKLVTRQSEDYPVSDTSTVRNTSITQEPPPAGSRSSMVRFTTKFKALFSPGQAFISAASQGDLISTRKIFSSNGSFEPAVLRKALLEASMKGYTDIVTFLVDCGADVNATARRETPLLCLVARRGNSATASILIEKGADLNCVDADGYTPLMWAVIKENSRVVRVLVERGANVHTVNHAGKTALTCGILGHHEDIVRYLLENGADYNGEPEETTIPMAQAAQCTDARFLKMLLQEGASIEPRDPSKYGALKMAVMYGPVSVARYLIEMGADIECDFPDRCTPLVQIASSSRTEMAEMLLECGARIEGSPDILMTPLIAAATWRSDDMTKLLIRRGANLEAVDRDKRTALIVASRNGFEKVVKALIDSNANLDARDSQGYTALRWAIVCQHEKVVKLLIQNGSEIEYRNGTSNLLSETEDPFIRRHIEQAVRKHKAAEGKAK